MSTITANAALTSTAIALYWTSENEQSDLLGDGCTAAELMADILAQCGTDEQRAAVMAGTVTIED